MKKKIHAVVMIPARTTPAMTQIHHFLYHARDGAGAGF